MFRGSTGFKKAISNTGWQPNENTIYYLPFTEDVLDHSGNNHTITVEGGNNYSFTTFSNGGGCMSLNPSSTQTYFTVSGSDAIWNYNTSATWAYKISEASMPDGSDSWAATAGFAYALQVEVCKLSQTTASGYNTGNLRLPGGYEWTGSSSTRTSYDESDIRCTSTTVYSVIWTFDATTKTLKAYVDSTLFSEGVFTAGPSRSSDRCVIWKDVYANDPRRCLRGKVAHIVYESGVWDNDRIQQYVNLS